MKKTILFLGLIAILSACGTQTSETEVITTDSTEVVTDTTIVSTDTTKVDSTSTVVVEAEKEVK
jgi:hypothetical protein